MIRQADLSDLAELVSLGCRFFRASPHSELMAVMDHDIEAGLRTVLESGVVFVSEVEGKVVGMLAGVLTSLWFAPAVPVATELAWWVDKKHRGPSGVKLLYAFEAWATKNRAKMVCMTDLVSNGRTEDNKRLFQKLGYRAMERSLVREV